MEIIIVDHFDHYHNFSFFRCRYRKWSLILIVVCKAFLKFFSFRDLLSNIHFHKRFHSLETLSPLGRKCLRYKKYIWYGGSISKSLYLCLMTHKIIYEWLSEDINFYVSEPDSLHIPFIDGKLY